MTRVRLALVAVAACLPATGCCMCAHPFDYCGATADSPPCGCRHHSPIRVGSAFAPPPPGPEIPPDGVILPEPGLLPEGAPAPLEGQEAPLQPPYEEKEFDPSKDQPPTGPNVTKTGNELRLGVS